MRHIQVLCELLPVSVPSLVTLLAAASLGGLSFPVSRRVQKLLGCDNTKLLITPAELARDPAQWNTQRCSFPGQSALALLARYHQHRAQVTGATYRQV